MQLTATVLVALLNTSVLGLSPDTTHSRGHASATANLRGDDANEALDVGPCPIATKPFCCDSALLGLVFSGCKTPKVPITKPTDLTAICVARGKLAKCCPPAVGGLTLGCMDPKETADLDED